MAVVLLQGEHPARRVGCGRTLGAEEIMPRFDSLEPLMVDELRDLLDAEKQITKALPKMAKAASSEELKSAFEEHLDQTNEQIERLNDVFEELGEKARGKKC